MENCHRPGAWAGPYVVLVVAFGVPACGPEIMYDWRVPEFAAGSTGEDGVWAFAKREVGDDYLSVYVTNARRSSCEDPYELGQADSSCAREDVWLVKLFALGLYEVPSTLTEPENLGAADRYWVRTGCEYGGGPGIGGAWLALDEVTPEYVDGTAGFTALDGEQEVAFSAPVCPWR